MAHKVNTELLEKSEKAHGLKLDVESLNDDSVPAEYLNKTATLPATPAKFEGELDIVGLNPDEI